MVVVGGVFVVFVVGVGVYCVGLCYVLVCLMECRVMVVVVFDICCCVVL